jgi:hypothetical protein
MWIQGINLCRVYNYYDSRALSYKRSGILMGLDSCGLVKFQVQVLVESIGQFCCALFSIKVVRQ